MSNAIDGSTHLNNIESVSKSIDEVKSAAGSYSGGFLSALALQNSAFGASQVMQKMSGDLDTIDMFSEQGSVTVSDGIAALTPEYINAVNLIALKVGGIRSLSHDSSPLIRSSYPNMVFPDTEQGRTRQKGCAASSCRSTELCGSE